MTELMYKQYNAVGNYDGYQADYQAALKEIEILMMAEPDTPEGEKLDVLVTLVEAYERKHSPLDLPDPVEAIKFEMEQKGLTANIKTLNQKFAGKLGGDPG